MQLRKILILKVSVVTENIQRLLILQDRHLNVIRIRSEIERLPREIKKLEDLIEKEKEEAGAKKSELQELEVKRKELELDVESAEEQIAKYKTQQMQVKKNDEYKALTMQIEQTEEKISNLETEELELMEAIDVCSDELKDIQAEVDKRVKYQEGLIDECHQKKSNLEAELSDAEKAYEDQLTKCEPADISLFEKLKNQIKRPPYIVEIVGQNCGGCHMRVSNDSLKKAKIGQPALCDQCARLVYVDL